MRWVAAVDDVGSGEVGHGVLLTVSWTLEQQSISTSKYLTTNLQWVKS
jgi:hypothetical protein